MRTPDTKASFGTSSATADKDALVEFLKTF